MQTHIVRDITSIPAAEWNRVAGTDHPFTRHEFLAALERHHCVGERHGWLPVHITVRDDSGRLCGMAPLYEKNNSYGEFVFDWAWADAWQRNGINYYPKLVSSIPFTPVTGHRLLVDPQADGPAVTRQLIETALSLTRESGASTLHWLFTNEQDTDRLLDFGLLRRTSCHFHWHNDGYASFEDFLAALSSRKRKKIRRERRRVYEAGIEMRCLHGHEMTDEDWQIMFEFYRSTFERKWGVPTLTLDFFREISRTMGEQLLLVFAMQSGEAVAGAIMLRGADALYGRHWGCREDWHSLHFETCYYQGIDYCIRHGLQLFEPGAQGEHKISRGFLPTYTWSAHWINDLRFRDAIARFLVEEHEMMVAYHDELQLSSPFRQDGNNE
ncbi:MAG TPA: GNAT family N-acetyltransferase [Gammaproteobacteria bacterium]|nr:GNAT family N-acetyltransferase [Gammaproteobacteria bacterium]